MAGEKTITMLALLGATRDSIAIIMALPRHSHIVHHLKTPLTFDQICDIVQETIHFWPEILAAATSNHSLPRLYCQRQLQECRTSLWLLEQNTKGIAVLPRLALDYYVGLWGPRPYTQLVALHLNKFDKVISCKKRFRLFRNNWGFYYAKNRTEGSHV